MEAKRKFFVTGVGEQLGYDVINELAKRGYKGVRDIISVLFIVERQMVLLLIQGHMINWRL